MKRSEHNIVAKIPERDVWLIANLLSGSADLLSADEIKAYEEGRFPDPSAWAERGYLVDPEEEEKRFKAAYLTFLKERETDEVQLFFTPTFACNFACGYCYQEPYRQDAPWDDAVTDAFFRYVDGAFAGRKKYFTLFGGEPLLPSSSHQENVRRFLKRAEARGLETAIVTNGYTVRDYLDVLKSARIREVQVTLDGPREIHNRRRPLKGGGGTFDRVADGVDTLLAHNIPVNLRVVLDRENIDALPPLADIAAERGWNSHPSFKTQLGRNYELHRCARSPEKLFDRTALAEDLVRVIREHPSILEFHRPLFHFAKHLHDRFALPSPIFDACPGTKTEWAFDSAGGIYSCTATVGKPSEKLGTFFPENYLDTDAVFEWQDRDVLSISECTKCPSMLVCGGGCGALAKNRTGYLHSPDCRMAAEIAAFGCALYLEPSTKQTDTKQ